MHRDSFKCVHLWWVAEQTIRQKLPAGFQRSEFLLDHGAIDMIIHRHDMKNTLSSILAKLTHQTVEFEDTESAPVNVEDEQKAEA